MGSDPHDDEGGRSYLAALSAIGAFQRAFVGLAIGRLEAARGRLSQAAGVALGDEVFASVLPKTRLNGVRDDVWSWAWLGAALPLQGVGHVVCGVS